MGLGLTKEESQRLIMNSMMKGLREKTMMLSIVRSCTKLETMMNTTMTILITILLSLVDWDEGFQGEFYPASMQAPVNKGPVAISLSLGSVQFILQEMEK